MIGNWLVEFLEKEVEFFKKKRLLWSVAKGLFIFIAQPSYFATAHLLWRAAFALYLNIYFFDYCFGQSVMAVPAEALAKAGGGDGNRTHVRRKSSQKYYMFIFQVYELAALKAEHYK